MILLYVEVKCMSPDTHRSYAHHLMLLTGAASCVTPAPVNARVPASIQTGTFPLAGSHIYSTLGRLQGSTKERLEFKSHLQSLFAIHMDFKKVTENGIQKLFWCKKISEIYASGFFSNTFSIQLLKFPHFLSIYIYVCMYICVCLSSIFSATNKR